MIANPAWIKAKYECVGVLLASSEQEVIDSYKSFSVPVKVTITSIGPEWETNDGRKVRWYEFKAEEI